MDDIRQPVRRFLEGCMNSGDLSEMDAIFAEDFLWHGSGGAGEIQGVPAFREVLVPFLEAFPDLTTTIHEMVVEGDRVVARFSCTGTHRGEVMGIPATGRTAEWIGINIYRVLDGRIVEEWSCEDSLALLQSIGAAPA